MPKWTEEQLQAINKSGSNIIVSAGAGSGKTAVLTQRVITKLENGININNLLILTFTNAAASEMKDRIRNAIKKNNELKPQLDYLDSSYITTFDSFSMSIVKKYHYILNISNSLNIVEKSICDSIRSKMLDEIFLEKYENKDEKFLKLINDFCIKDDSEIKKGLLLINEKLDILSNKSEYLNNYVDNYYNNIDKLIKSFNKLVFDKIEKIKYLLNDLGNYCETKYYNSVYDNLINLLDSKSYDEVKNNIDLKIPNVPKNSEEKLKEIKSKIVNEIKNLKELLIYKDENHIKGTLLETKEYAISIIDILLVLDKRIMDYKYNCNQYEFNDIAKMALKIIKENEFIKEELKNSFAEIMIDEYQDTSDIQDELISLISKNNTYMVGDIKQSIYRFRNANPDIFKEKYENYSKKNGGIKIDLLNNFRSRKETLDDINKLFDSIMTLDFGGADYQISHRMNFGNELYNINDIDFNKNLEIYNYKRENKSFSNAEYEAFIIANDIKNKINQGYKVLDKNSNQLRKANYGDFCILIDRKSNFELYKKIFEFLGLPLVIYYDEKMTEEKDILIIKNIIDMVVKIYKHEDFRYNFYSISRSYIGNMKDQEFLDYYINNNFNESDIYLKCLSISDHLTELSNRQLIEEIVNKFDFYEKTILVGEMDKSIVRIDYLKKIADNLSSLGYSIMEFNDYLKEMVLSDNDITFSINTKVENNVKLMNIHKSKGLEFSICYFAGYSNKFNKMDLNNRISFDKNLGFILPFYEDGLGNSITKFLYKEKYLKEDISERIRLLYVALTRAREKMIIVTSLSDKEYEISDELRMEYNSFLSIIESIKNKVYDNIVEIKDISLTKNYNYSRHKVIDIESCDKISVNEINLDNDILVSKKASKIINKVVMNQDELDYGLKVHKLFEVSDLLNSDNELIRNFRKKFNNLESAKIYKEYEFITRIDNNTYNGIIDLIIEHNDHVDIVDYKLKNINDNNYIKQLMVYKNYISNKLNKETRIYLYSILDNELREIEVNNEIS